MKAVSIHAFEHDLLAVEIQAIARPHFERAKAESRLDLVS
jgi:hypothetical protein